MSPEIKFDLPSRSSTSFASFLLNEASDRRVRPNGVRCGWLVMTSDNAGGASLKGFVPQLHQKTIFADTSIYFSCGRRFLFCEYSQPVFICMLCVLTSETSSGARRFLWSFCSDVHSTWEIDRAFSRFVPLYTSTVRFIVDFICELRSSGVSWN